MSNWYFYCNIYVEVLYIWNTISFKSTEETTILSPMKWNISEIGTKRLHPFVWKRQKFSFHCDIFSFLILYSSIIGTPLYFVPSLGTHSLISHYSANMIFVGGWSWLEEHASIKYWEQELNREESSSDIVCLLNIHSRIRRSFLLLLLENRLGIRESQAITSYSAPKSHPLAIQSFLRGNTERNAIQGTCTLSAI